MLFHILPDPGCDNSTTDLSFYSVSLLIQGSSWCEAPVEFHLSKLQIFFKKLDGFFPELSERGSFLFLPVDSFHIGILHILAHMQLRCSPSATTQGTHGYWQLLPYCINTNECVYTSAIHTLIKLLFFILPSPSQASKQHRLKRYHSQSYVNGSKCDLNEGPRETEVRFVCEEGSGVYVASVDEPQSCRYVLTVHTTRTCQHPFLCPPSTAKPQGIVCQPALSTKQYMDYVKAQVSDTKRKVEQISEELKTLDEILTGDEGTDGRADEQTDEESATPTEVTDVLGSDTEAFGDEKFNFKIITDPADLMKFVQHLKESNRKKAQNEAEREALRKEKERRGAEDEDEEERLLLQEFDEEIAGLSVPSANIEEMNEEMQKEFDNIIDEAQRELDTEGLKGEFDSTQATQTLETTLDKLLDRLEDKEAGDTEAEHLTEGGQKANDPARGSPSLAPQQPVPLEI
ncbi:protein OS-9-like [Salmo salar]|uniref:Endoplasmic reticulum lectin n=1 Tax=Salmo salar TaxID=8030 RepID=A0ABM3CNH4_SALSA|nr:protein OS-9-like [Salmo salar]